MTQLRTRTPWGEPVAQRQEHGVLGAVDRLEDVLTKHGDALHAHTVQLTTQLRQLVAAQRDELVDELSAALTTSAGQLEVDVAPQSSNLEVIEVVVATYYPGYDQFGDSNVYELNNVPVGALSTTQIVPAVPGKRFRVLSLSLSAVAATSLVLNEDSGPGWVFGAEVGPGGVPIPLGPAGVLTATTGASLSIKSSAATTISAVVTGQYENPPGTQGAGGTATVVLGSRQLPVPPGVTVLQGLKMQLNANDQRKLVAPVTGALIQLELMGHEQLSYPQQAW